LAGHLTKPEIAVLRWGHRFRDQRVTAHVALVARAFGASKFILADIEDEKIKDTIQKITANWGGKLDFEMGKPWKKAVEELRNRGYAVIHLTVYGENIQTSNVMDRIRATGKNILIIVGSQKVPGEFFHTAVSDFNVAVGNQPHSEISSLAVFLDRFHKGEELSVEFTKARLRVLPQKRGKKVAKS